MREVRDAKDARDAKEMLFMAIKKPFASPASLASFLIVIGFLLRLGATFNEFWHDEFLSWALAQNALSIWEIIFSMPYDNNHIFNTMMMYLLGDQSNWIIYRIPSVLFGTASIFVAGLIGNLQSKYNAFFAMSLFTSSFMMILYSSEARGYAPLIFCSLSAMYLTLQYGKQQSAYSLLVFWITCLIGFLSHITFIIICAALGAWMLMEYRSTLHKHWKKLLAWWGLPALFMAGYYTLVYSNMVVVNNHDNYSVLLGILQTIILPMGVPRDINLIALMIIVFTGICGWSLWTQWKQDRPLWMFYLVTLCSILALLIHGVAHQAYAVRFALVPLTCVYLLMAYGLGNLCKQSKYGAWLAHLVLIGFVVINAVEIGNLYSMGRSTYLSIIEHVVSQPGNKEVITIGGNRDATHLAVQFYQNAQRPNLNIQYSTFASPENIAPLRYIVKEDPISIVDSPPQWYIEHEKGGMREPGSIVHLDTVEYAVERSEKQHRHSGYMLHLLKRIGI